jgi:hypothetical protein
MHARVREIGNVEQHYRTKPTLNTRLCCTRIELSAFGWCIGVVGLWVLITCDIWGQMHASGRVLSNEAHETS